jgi:hypothetical protein
MNMKIAMDAPPFRHQGLNREDGVFEHSLGYSLTEIDPQSCCCLVSKYYCFDAGIAGDTLLVAYSSPGNMQFNDQILISNSRFYPNKTDKS